MKDTGTAVLLLGALCLPVVAGAAVAGETIGIVRTVSGAATITRGEKSLPAVRVQFPPSEGKFDLVARISRGTMAYLSGKIGKLAPEKARIEAPTATIGIRGTPFAGKVWEPSSR
jgi:hypothetical protein